MHSIARTGPILIALTVLCHAATPGATETLDVGATHYSPLRQITPHNVNPLVRAWPCHRGEKWRQFETDPLLAGGLLCSTSQSSRVIALDLETAKEVCHFDPHVDLLRDSDGQLPPRVLLATGVSIALNASRELESGFGEKGPINLRKRVSEAYPNSGYAITSPPAIYRNVVIERPSTQAEGRSQRVGADHGRQGERAGPPTDGEPRRQLLWRGSEGHEPVRKLRGSTGRRNREAALVLPNGTP